ncbi:hypothetical protein QQF64_009985 [Cirrhinus molitorella]|uniref:Uncharacterized protein n=1 Tax=Cirrhinus molitorella TaxID=172907 RepID=A0ABR3M2Q0_9TELE
MANTPSFCPHGVNLNPIVRYETTAVCERMDLRGRNRSGLQAAGWWEFKCGKERILSSRGVGETPEAP